MSACPKCWGKGVVSESLFDKVPCDWCHGSGIVPDEDETPEVDGATEGAKAALSPSLTPAELRDRLWRARQSGIRDCQRALLQQAVAITTETVAAAKGKGEPLGKGEAALRVLTPELRKRAVFLVYDRLKDVETWAWNADNAAVACVHERREIMENERGSFVFCVQCGAAVD
jgi:hypothetical protein